MKQIITSSIILLMAITSLFATEGEKKTLSAKNDTTSFTEITGKIVDGNTDQPIVFASVLLTGTSIATVTNTDGEFVLKVPKGNESGSISFTYLGYQNISINISDFNNEKKLIKINAVAIPIDAVIIKSINPKELILSAIENIKNNYSNAAEMQTGFYRETIKQNRKYTAVSEAVMDIYKAPYKSNFDNDKIKIYKGRKSRDVKKMDTLIVKLQGGPKTSLMLDLVNIPGDVLQPDILDYYEFELQGKIFIDNRETYVIYFDQIEGVEYPLYSGKIYIDIDSKAFAGMDFELSERGLPFATDILVKKKPNNLNIEVIKGNYLVRYRKDADNWCLNYVRSELALTSKWKKQVFKSDYNIMLEMAVTDRDKENIIKFTNKESAKMNDIFAEKVSSFEDDNFWGEYNTIKPNESIEIAIQKLNKKVKRRQ